MPQNKELSVLVCQNRYCKEAGSTEVLATFQEFEDSNYKVIAADCQGQCSCSPTVRIIPEETWYCRVQPTDVPVIVQQHLQGGKRVEEKLNPRIHMRFG